MGVREPQRPGLPAWACSPCPQHPPGGCLSTANGSSLHGPAVHQAQHRSRTDWLLGPVGVASRMCTLRATERRGHPLFIPPQPKPPSPGVGGGPCRGLLPGWDLITGGCLARRDDLTPAACYSARASFDLRRKNNPPPLRLLEPPGRPCLGRRPSACRSAGSRADLDAATPQPGWAGDGAGYRSSRPRRWGARIPHAAEPGLRFSSAPGLECEKSKGRCARTGHRGRHGFRGRQGWKGPPRSAGRRLGLWHEDAANPPALSPSCPAGHHQPWGVPMHRGGGSAGCAPAGGRRGSTWHLTPPGEPAKGFARPGGGRHLPPGDFYEWVECNYYAAPGPAPMLIGSGAPLTSPGVSWGGSAQIGGAVSHCPKGLHHYNSAPRRMDPRRSPPRARRCGGECPALRSAAAGGRAGGGHRAAGRGGGVEPLLQEVEPPGGRGEHCLHPLGGDGEPRCSGAQDWGGGACPAGR